MPQVPKYKLKPLNLSSEKVGERIRRLRKERGLTQAELADEIGISRQLVTNYEIGRLKLNEEMLIRFAVVLKVSSDEILGLKTSEYENEPPPSLRIMRRMQEIDHLPEQKKKAILKTIDDLIRANK
jgi:transcriptional regulator with XRE-family HTH domain